MNLIEPQNNKKCSQTFYFYSKNAKIAVLEVYRFRAKTKSTDGI